MLPKILATLLFAALLAQSSNAQPATRVYGTQFDEASPLIRSWDLNGSGPVSLTMPLRPKCVAVDWRSIPSKLYVGLVPTSGVGKIIRCNTDGTGQEDVVTNTTSVSDIELDLNNRKVYWLQNTYSDDRIFHADMDGTDLNVTQIYATTVAARDLWGLALDVPGQRLWITERGSTSYSSYIRRMTFSGASVTTIVSPVDNPHDIEYHNNFLYWGDRDGLERGNPDGTGIDTIVGGAKINGLAIDGSNNRIYWADYGSYSVRRVDFDGSNRLEIASAYLDRLDTDYNPSAADVGEEAGMPQKFELGQNFPNPFNPETGIRYQVSGVSGRPTFVSLRVYDLLGREVATLVNEQKPPGTHTVTWDAKGMASGVYLYRLKAGEFVQTKRMALVR